MMNVCEYVRHLNVAVGEYIGISPLTKKKVKLKGGAVIVHCYFGTIHRLLKVLLC